MTQQQQKAPMEESPCAKEIAGFAVAAARQRANVSTAAAAAPCDVNRRFLRKDCRELYQKSKGLSEHNRHLESLNYWKCQFSEVPQPAREEYFVRIRRAQQSGGGSGRKEATGSKKGVDSPRPMETSAAPMAACKTTAFLKKLSPIQNFPQHHLNRQATAPFLHAVPRASKTTAIMVDGLRSPPTSMHHMDLRRHAPVLAEEGENDCPMARAPTKKAPAALEEEDDLIFPIEI